MQAMLQFIKNHLISLLCGVAGVAAITFASIGMSSDKVTAQMQKQIQETGAGGIAGLRRTPRNQALIDAKKKEGELFDAEYKATVESARKINARAPLMAGVFPKPARDATPFEFRESYRKALRVLPITLRAGALPSDGDILEEQQNVDDLVALEQERKEEEQADEDETRPGRPIAGRNRNFRPPPIQRPGVGGRRFTGRNLRPGGSGGEAFRGARFGGEVGPIGRAPAQSFSQQSQYRPPSNEPKYDPVYRARVSKAKSILCYVADDSFDVSPIVTATEAPAPADMWFAQVGLWIQQDVAAAVADMNDEAAAKIKNGDPYVANVPVKRIVAIRVQSYEVTPADDQKPGRIGFPTAMAQSGRGMIARGMSSDLGGSFTGRKSNEQYDVVRFTVEVVVDQREVLRLIDRISRENFYECLAVSYQAVDRAVDQDQEGYYYGPTPVVRTTLEFEAYMLREVYQPLMPAPIKAALGIEDKEE